MVFSTRDLAVYASVIATLDGGWTIFNGAIRDRARVVVTAYQGEAIAPDGGPRQPLFMVRVSNRGRRPVNVEAVSRLENVVRGTHIASADFGRQLAGRPRLDESQAQTFVHGELGGYQHGDLPTSRWYVVDGAGRIHPLRERYRQRLLGLIFWPVRRVLSWRDARAGIRERP